MKIWGLMSIWTGEVKLKSGDILNLCLVKKGDLMSFKKKKDAVDYRNSKCAWALKPMKIHFEVTYWNSEEVFYHFIDNLK
jgi:hypothetical protein